MPSAWQGKYKLTANNYFCASVARNTGVCYAKYDYLTFVDDLSIMSPGLVAAVISSCNSSYTMAYGYKKVYNLEVDNGSVVNCLEHQAGIDSRWHLGPIANINGSSFFGYISLPLEHLLKVNGYDEICNSIGGEDYNLGVRLEKSGISLRYLNSSFYYESENVGSQDVSFFRIDPLLSNIEYKSLMNKFSIKTRWVENGRTDVSHLLLDMVFSGSCWTRGNNYNLRELREYILNGGKIDTTFSDNLQTCYGVFLKELDSVDPKRHIELMDTTPEERPVTEPYIPKQNVTKKFAWTKIGR
jgi:hypothetical protein